ncbi:wall-associated receptor kinase 2-like [Cynara cardunculus var. scolymus]|uniref:wall-associated receptor kinase 2-like n=1 Tax=Cynara cardunculus var. scolymus TaxID=59895 RepID=UPI000D62A8FB|nr:wall-associated receptor kinase 2-like [Cynara cardunculus var. scolymus]
MEVMTSVEVLEIKLNGQLRVALPIAHSCYSKQGRVVSGSLTEVSTSRFPFSSTLNMFTGVGCDIQAHIMLTKAGGVAMSCKSDCDQRFNVRNGSCLGHGCCHLDPIPEGMTSAAFDVLPTENHTKIWDFGRCGYGFLVEKDIYNFKISDLSTMSKNMSFSVVLDWSVGDTKCKEAQKDNVTYRCKENSVCYNGKGSLPGYRCKCSQGYKGNPYIENGCKDVNECESGNLNDCLPGHCNNTDGSYACVCAKGFQGDAKIGGECIPVHKSEGRSVIAGIGEGVAGAVVAMIFVYWGAKSRIRIKSRKDFFKKNGGIMLQKMLFTCEDPINTGKIFTEKELKKATQNFNTAKVIGQGGYGTVYIGTLANKTMVAIKKSKMIDQTQIKQFVNEVIILSQINHPNIVKLLGCCLETHVPLLVYEYITNNTLCHHIHSHATLTLGNRLKIAAETAEALDYMHSTTQIIHRDVKPSNILLDDEFTAKISDFGISRFVPLGQTHLSTSVKGTIGYMDPEYFRTCKLTEKSDVYSFGVVLMELLMGVRVQSLEIPLTAYAGAAAYLASLLTHDALLLVLDDQIKKDKYGEVVKCVAKIAINCLHLEGNTRPTMSTVKQELEQLRCALVSIDAESHPETLPFSVL